MDIQDNDGPQVDDGARARSENAEEHQISVFAIHRMKAWTSVEQISDRQSVWRVLQNLELELCWKCLNLAQWKAFARNCFLGAFDSQLGGPSEPGRKRREHFSSENHRHQREIRQHNSTSIGSREIYFTSQSCFPILPMTGLLATKLDQIRPAKQGRRRKSHKQRLGRKKFRNIHLSPTWSFSPRSQIEIGISARER